MRKRRGGLDWSTMLCAGSIDGEGRGTRATIAQNGPLAVRKIKEAVRERRAVRTKKRSESKNEIAREVMKSEDAKEGPRSFMEKRKPIYKGR